MKFKLDINYSEEELKFIEENNCEILSEIKLSRTNFPEGENPRRMLNYYGTYIAEVYDNESGELLWAVLSKWKRVYRWTQYYDSLETLQQNL
ncbi:MAG: hypothetical protein K2G63_02830 [Oscillospiraceae bacterium]|nr:hypothetical protein [Oscillospiraceae bacterium]